MVCVAGVTINRFGSFVDLYSVQFGDSLAQHPSRGHHDFAS